MYTLTQRAKDAGELRGMIAQLGGIIERMDLAGQFALSNELFDASLQLDRIRFKLLELPSDAHLTTRREERENPSDEVPF